MGYTTDIEGRFRLDRPLAPEHAAYLRRFSETRRMKRDPKKLARRKDKLRIAAGLDVGPDGAYFVAGRTEGLVGDQTDPSIVDINTPPGQPTWESLTAPNGEAINWAAYEEARERSIADGAQPGLWCQWCPSRDGTAIEWDGAEKFYQYIPWLEYLIAHFLAPWGYVLNGRVDWAGQDHKDRGAIFVRDNVVKAVRARSSVANPFDDPDAAGALDAASGGR